MSIEDGFICYVPRNFQQKSLDTLEWVHRVIAQYARAGYTLSLRQLYYQGVARNLIPNDVKSYDRLQEIVANARKAGLISWYAIEDRGSSLQGWSTHGSPAEALHTARDAYRREPWATQPYRLECWVEKIALESVIGRVCSEQRVDYYATEGYDSLSQIWRAGAERFKGYAEAGQTPVLLHLADHDPSGVHMTRNLREDLTMFAGLPVKVDRVALNLDQVKRYKLPPNPAKMTDDRTPAYIKEFGTDKSWELDALDPSVIEQLIRDKIAKYRDDELFKKELRKETRERKALDQVVTKFEGGLIERIPREAN